jgi:hypothetical protein
MVENSWGEESVFTECGASACRWMWLIEPTVASIEQWSVSRSGWAHSDAEE